MAATEKTTVSEEAYADLDQFAERSLQEADRSETIMEMPALLARGTIYLIGAAVLVTLGLLYFGKVNIVVSAKGRIIPEGDVLIVQALQSGVVNAVLARAGDRLPAGAPIVKLDVSEPGITLAELRRRQELQKSQLLSLRRTLAAVSHILSQPQRALTEEVSNVAGNAAQPISGLANALMQLGSAKEELQRLPERKGLKSREIELLRENTQLNEKNHQAQQPFLAGEQRALAQKLEQLKNYRRLGENNLISPLELSGEEEKYRAAESALMSLRQRLAQQEIDISNQKLKLSELEARLLTEQTETETNYRLAEMNYQQNRTALRQETQTLTAQIQELEANVKTSEEKIRMAETKISLTTITMPVSGTIAELKVNNSGELIAAGAMVASVAPDGVPLVVEAAVENKDIGFVKPGLEARIKVDAYPFQQFGTVPGQVVRVLPSSGNDSNFTVHLRLLQDRVGAQDSSLYLFPGLTVQAEMLTAKQRLLSMLFKKEEGE